MRVRSTHHVLAQLVCGRTHVRVGCHAHKQERGAGPAIDGTCRGSVDRGAHGQRNVWIEEESGARGVRLPRRPSVTSWVLDFGFLAGWSQALHHQPSSKKGYTMQRFTRSARLSVVLLSVLVLLVLSMSTAFADSPHFVSASAKLSGANLVVSFKEAGLGTNQLIDYEADANATAIYVCVNHGGANPSASNKTTVSGPVSATGSFSSGKNGNVTASLTLMPPPPPATFSCPKGQHQETAEVTYTDVSITDTTHGITEPIPGTFDTGCLLPNVRGAC